MLCHMAGMIKKEDIERVRNAADLYDIVSATVALKPSGVGAYVGLCPFHDERTPSFNVRRSAHGIASAAVVAVMCSGSCRSRRT